MYRTIIRSLSILLLSILGVAKANAQAYLYIQSDKSTPFYVKINGVMQQRYSKNYCIAPRLKPGKTDVEILFQQNEWPAQHFSVDIPEAGKCGYILNKEGDVFSLYDLETKK